MTRATRWSITAVNSTAGEILSSQSIGAPAGKSARMIGVNWGQTSSGGATQYFRILNAAGSTVLADTAGARLSGYIGDADGLAVQSSTLVFEFSASGAGVQSLFAWGEYVG